MYGPSFKQLAKQKDEPPPARVCCGEYCNRVSRDLYPYPGNKRLFLCKPCYEDYIRREYRGEPNGGKGDE